MGYYMNQRDSDFRIKKENFEDALAVLVELADDKHRNQMDGGIFQHWPNADASYAWVDMDELKNAKTIAQAMSAWRWEVDVDDDIVDITFAGEKLGDDMVMLEAIAPFVEDDSYIEMSGDDGCIWRWTFNKGVCTEMPGTVVFHDPF